MFGFICVNSYAQSDINLSTKLTSQHYWRGMLINKSANVESSIAYQKSGFNAGFWGGYAFNGEYSEFDWFVSYEFKNGIKLSVWDLYASRDRSSIQDYKYFNLERESSNHLLDASVSYQFSEGFPLNISWSTMLWGRDLDANDNQRYSSYLGLSYPMKLREVDVELSLGMNVFEHSMYAEKTNIVQLGASFRKQIKFTEEFQLPIQTEILVNPDQETAHLIVSVLF